MNRRRPGLQRKWAHVVNSLQRIIPSYERASSRISLFEDGRMRAEAVSFAVRKGSLVLDLGAGPGTMSRLVSTKGGDPVLLDVSRGMLQASGFSDRVQGAFEFLPFRTGAFDAAVSGFALRDSYDLGIATGELSRVIKLGGRFGLCDLGRPDSAVKALMIGAYMAVAPGLIGLVSVGKAGLGYSTLFDTYVLSPHNSDLTAFLASYFREVKVHETRLGGSIVAKCTR